MNKNLIYVITPEIGSGGGCVWHRIMTIANYINSVNSFNTKVIVSPTPTFDQNILTQCKSILIQRPVFPMPWLKNLKELQPRFGYSICGEIDDLFTEFHGESIPDYNAASLQPRDWNAIDKIIVENLQYIDRMICSTEYLARVYNEKFNYWNTVVIENAVPRSLYNVDRKTFFRDKPLCIIPSGKQHMREPQPITMANLTGITGLRGDYTGEWVEWIRDAVKNDKIDLIEMAGTSYVFDDIRDKIATSPWFDVPNYAGYLCRIRPDIIIAPLKNNVFNRAKSCLKFAEGCALGSIVMGTTFDKSPYERIHPLSKVPDNPTFEQLDTVFNNIKTNWKDILNYQYNFINSHGDWIESVEHVNKWLNAVSIPNQQLI